MLINRTFSTALPLASFIAFILCLPIQSYALGVGDKLPAVEITSLGKIITDNPQGKNSSYAPWSTKSLAGKKWVIQHIAPRMRVGSLNIDLSDAIKDIDYPETCRTVSIINLGEAMFGTYLIAKSEVKKGLLRNYKCTVVADKEHTALKAWGLNKKRNITMVVNREGVIEFYHDGKLSQEQIQQVIEMTNADWQKPATEI